MHANHVTLESDKADCSNSVFRLCVYEAGHTITAYLMGQKIHSIQMLPRPPMTITDKPFTSYSWDSFIETLESRVLELFGGQISEEIICNSPTCCAGDISRIDEITRILEALYSDDEVDSEDILFDLEEQAQKMFEPEHVREAIIPVANYLFQQEMAGNSEIDGDEVTAIIAQYIPAPARKKTGLLAMLNIG